MEVSVRFIKEPSRVRLFDVFETILAPPTYHEAVGSAVQLNEDGEHTLGSRPFLPMYPVYNFNNDQSSSSTSGYENNGFRADTPLPGSISDAAIIQKY